MLQTNRSPCPRGGASAKSGAAPGPATSLSKNTGLFGQEAPGEVGLSGRRAEIGNHEVAGKSGVMTLAALPRNHENAVKSKTWRSFSFFVAVHAAKEGKGTRTERHRQTTAGPEEI
jgi:hypothetical protein